MKVTTRVGTSIIAIAIMLAASGSADAQVVHPIGNGNVAVDMTADCGVVFSPNGNVVTRSRSCTDHDVRRARDAYTTWQRGGSGYGDEYADGDSGGPDFWEVHGVRQDGLGLMDRPSLSGRVVDRRLRDGTRLRNLGCEWHDGERWCRVEHGSTVGWVQQQWLREAGSDAGGYGGSGYQQATRQITCSSEGGRYQLCTTDTHGGVRMVEQLSTTTSRGGECIFNETWGYDGSGIWVDRGCRARFEVGGDGPHSGSGHAQSGRQITCSSEGGRHQFCATDTRGGVRMIDQLSKTTSHGGQCIFNETWGYDGSGIWVDRGCRATFEIGGGSRHSGSGHAHSDHELTCSSEGGRHHFCSADTRGGVRLVEQLSKTTSRGGQCIFNETWGYDGSGIWVDRGCRARFEIGGGW